MFWMRTKSDGCRSNAPVYHVYPVSCKTGSRRAGFKGRGGGGEGGTVVDKGGGRKQSGFSTS